MLFAFGTIWFWALFGLFIIMEIIWTERESFLGSFFTVAALLACLTFWSDIAIFAWLVSNPVTALMYVGGYFLIGPFWATIKWFSYLKRETLEYKVGRMEWLQLRNVAGATLNTEVPPNLRKDWKDSSEYGGLGRKTLNHLKASQQKGRIIMWMMHWPLSMIGTVVRDPFIHMYNFLAEKFQILSEQIVGEAVGNDMEVPETASGEKSGQEFL